MHSFNFHQSWPVFSISPFHQPIPKNTKYLYVAEVLYGCFWLQHKNLDLSV